MRIERWVLIPAGQQAQVMADLTVLGSSPRIQPRERLGVRVLCEIELEKHHLRQLQAMTGVKVLLSLTAPAAKLPAAILTILSNEGVTLDAGDDVQTAIRKLRDARGHTDRYDVDKSF